MYTYITCNITIDGNDEVEYAKERSVENGAPDQRHHTVDIDHLKKKDVTNRDNHGTNWRDRIRHY